MTLNTDLHLVLEIKNEWSHTYMPSWKWQEQIYMFTS